MRQIGQAESAQDGAHSFWGEVPLFQRLPKNNYPALSSASVKVEFQVGEVIIEQGQSGDEFFVIKQGTATIAVDGHVVATVKQNDYFGEAALLRNEPRTATITAVTPILALKITRSEFQRLGLHEKLEFPKREKINKRHRMMAAGAAGQGGAATVRNSIVGKGADRSSSNMQRFSGEARIEDVMRMRAPKEPSASYWVIQFNALKEIFTDKLNVTAFILVPLGQIVPRLGFGDGAVFFANFFAIIPLASILGNATEALSVHTGQLMGGLLNATFGNAVEMIMCIQAVKAGLISVVQGNLLGSVLSNLLLVLGMAIFASGIKRKSQEFNAQGAAANMTCQLVASISVCLPTCFGAVADESEDEVLMISRICSVFLMSVYGMFLFFMLKTHADLFADEGEEEEDEDALGVFLSIVLLLLSTLVVFFCSECLVDSIEGVSENYGLSKEFIGVILLPIVGNAAEHATAVTCAYKGMMDLALGVAVGSSTQIALFVVPCAVMFGWLFDQPMNLNFSVFDTTCQMLTVFLVSQVLQHGQTNWLHGAMLMTVYVFIAVETLFIQ